jgi:cytochrome c oxidase subunit 5a
MNLRFASSLRRFSGKAESFEHINARYVDFFQKAEDQFDVQRGLNNIFAHDFVPTVEVCRSALLACRRINDYATAVRLFEGIKDKVPKKSQYQEYVKELESVKTELGIKTREEIGI